MSDYNVKFCTKCDQFWEIASTSDRKVHYYPKDRLTRYGTPDVLCPKHQPQEQAMPKKDQKHEITIEKDIPMPELKPPQKKGKYPWPQMAVADSFFIKATDIEEKRRIASRLLSSAHSYGKNNGKKFSVRTLEKGVRIWRIH